MKASRTTLTLLGVLAIVLGLAVFAPPEAVEPATSAALERPVRTAGPAAAAPAPAPADAAPQPVAGVSGAAAPAPPGGDAQPGADEPRFAARAGETLFGAPRPAPAPPKPVAPPPPPPPAPVAETLPAVPFVVVGLMEPRGGRPTAWLAEGSRLHVAVAGDVLDDRWRIDTIDRKSVRLTFLPRATQHALPVPSEISR